MIHPFDMRPRQPVKIVGMEEQEARESWVKSTVVVLVLAAIVAAMVML
jgi:hypothetical protein